MRVLIALALTLVGLYAAAVIAAWLLWGGRG